jgi:hypothetical protein
MTWIVIAVWPDGTHSILHIGGDDSPDFNELFLELDVEANPFEAKLWYCELNADTHIGQVKDDSGNLIYLDYGNEDEALLPLAFPEGYSPEDAFGE